MHLLILLVGLVMFLTTLAFWVPPLTLATYGAAVFFSARDPFFQRRMLEGRQRPGLPEADKEPSPDRRARWLPRGQTREKVEAALEVRRKTIAAIEESDEVTREVLSGAIPKLQELGNGLVDLAHRRETAGSEILELQKLREPESGNQTGGRGVQDEIQRLQQEAERMDRELSDMVERLLTLRSRVVRVSLESGEPAREAAGSLIRNLDDLNRRVEALGETTEPPSG
jgi:chromosome segregation ATPase